MDTMELPVTLVLPVMLIVQFVRGQTLFTVLPVNQGIFFNLCLRKQHVIPVVQVDIGKILQTTFARLAMLLAQLARMKLPPDVLPATRDIFDNRRRQLALILVQMGIGEILQANLAVSAILIAQFVRVISLVNVPPVSQDISCSQLLQQQHVVPLVQLDIGRILQVTFAHLAILLAQLAQMEPTVNALPAEWDTFYNRYQQYALALAPLVIGRTLQVRLVLLATFIAQFVRVQAIINVLPVNQVIFCNHPQRSA